MTGPDHGNDVDGEERSTDGGESLDGREGPLGLLSGRTPPERRGLPGYVAPLPRAVEDLGLRLAWPIVAVNLLGTAFGFWYYGFHPVPLSDPLITWQFAGEPPVAWPLVPDSPVATFFVGASLAAWKLGHADRLPWLHALAFFGCLKLGLWTPYVLVVFADGFSYLHPAMYHFLVWSHLGMAVEAFVVYRYADFRPAAVAVAVGWYGLNDLVDYFVPVVGTPHHTLVPAQRLIGPGTGFTHPSPDHEIAAAGAVALTLLALALALLTRRALVARGGGD
jgi:uncharacterized membrane protein YpjA